MVGIILSNSNIKIFYIQMWKYMCVYVKCTDIYTCMYMHTYMVSLFKVFSTY